MPPPLESEPPQALESPRSATENAALAHELAECESLAKLHDEHMGELRAMTQTILSKGGSARPHLGAPLRAANGATPTGSPTMASTVAYLRDENRTLLSAVVRLQAERDELRRKLSAAEHPQPAAVARRPTNEVRSGIGDAVLAAGSTCEQRAKGLLRQASARTLQRTARGLLIRQKQWQRRQYGTMASAVAWKANHKRQHEAETARRGTETEESQMPKQTWRAVAWLSSLGICEVVARALLKPLRAIHGAEGGDGEELSFMRMLGRLGDTGAIRTLLTDGAVLDHLADELRRGVEQLEEGKKTQAQVARLYSKFSSEGSRTLQYGTLSTFYSGLAGVIGPPNPNLGDAMRREHCASEDSPVMFTSHNYGIVTNSQIEYAFVVAPEQGLRRLGLDEWPTEAKLRDDPELWERRRRPTNLSAFDERLAGINERLAALECAPLGIDELIGARLYTGAMYVKYNIVLRAAADPSAVATARRFAALCRGNKYVTSIHVIASAIVKLGKIMPAERVYRGVSDACIPPGFWAPDEFKIRGGIELGFMSATLDPDIAYGYAAACGRGMMVFETHMGSAPARGSNPSRRAGRRSRAPRVCACGSRGCAPRRRRQWSTAAPT